MITSPRVGIYGYDVNIEAKGTIDTSGKGCSSGKGIGAGSPVGPGKKPDCQGGGAAHAGNGGLSKSSNMASTPWCPIVKLYGGYDSMSISEGSGGGSTPKLK